MEEPLSENGKLYTLYGLLSDYDIKIPIIQRDYAQGRDEKSVQEIRERFLTALYSAVSEGSKLVLDFVYGSIRDGSKTFIPIDGQQRLTTLFLLHWYLAVLNKKTPKEYEYLLKFTYDTRESATEFCEAIISNQTDLPPQGESLSNKICKANWYHHIYNNDPTIQAMLLMLDSIHNKFYDLKDGYTNLIEKNVVSFWFLSLGGYGLTDDLFIKLNARGKRLTRFEIFKAGVEQAIERFNENPALIEMQKCWLKKIDNDWLDTFWEQQNENTEDRMFRFILFITRSLATENGDKYIEIKELEYEDIQKDIDVIKDADNLALVIDALNSWIIYSQYPLIQVALNNIIDKDEETYQNRAIVFGAILYGKYHPEKRTDDTFLRFLKYLTIGHRHANEDSKLYESDLNASNYGRFIKDLRQFISGIQLEADDLSLLQSLGNTQYGLSTFLAGNEKAVYCIQNGKLDQSRYSDIKALEKLSCFHGQIHNVFFDGRLWITPQKMEKLLSLQKTNPRLLLRCIQAMFLDKALLTNKYYGLWKWAKINDQEIDFAVSKEFFGFHQSDSGDYMWTANPGRELSQAVRSFIKECGQLPLADPLTEMNNWLQIRVNSLSDYTGLAPYIVKYNEFLGMEDEKCEGCVYLRPYPDSPLPSNEAARVFINLQSHNIFGNYGSHYNPFVMALNNLLTAKKSKVTITNPWMSNDQNAKILDEWVILSNARKLQLILHENGKRAWKFDDDSELDCGNSDCIEKALDFIMKM